MAGRSSRSPSATPGRSRTANGWSVHCERSGSRSWTCASRSHSSSTRPCSTAFPIFQLGGAIARIGEDETAFNGRSAGFTFNINATTATAAGFDEERAWARGLWEALAPYHVGVYVNYLMDEGPERVRQAYGAAKYDRLKAVKAKYDPENVFRLNQNIRPD